MYAANYVLTHSPCQVPLSHLIIIRGQKRREGLVTILFAMSYKLYYAPF